MSFKKLYLFWLLAALLLTISHPLINPNFSWLASYLGLVFLFKGSKKLKRWQRSFYISSIFGLVFFIWLRWMASSPYLAPLAELAAALLACSLACSLGVWALLFHRSWSPSARWVDMIAASLTFSVFEYSRQYWLCGFPWYSLAISWVPSSMGLFGWLGPFWSSFPLTLAAMKTANSSKTIWSVAVNSIALLALASISQASQNRFVAETSTCIHAMLVHSEMPLSIEAIPEPIEKTQSRLKPLIANFKNPYAFPLIIFPEGAITGYYSKQGQLPVCLDFGSKLACKTKAFVILGIEDDFSSLTQSSNSIAIFHPKGHVESLYAKRRLVPFAEYFPFVNIPFFSSWTQELAAAYGILQASVPGTQLGLTTLHWNDHALKVALSICFEETFLDEVMQMRQKGAQLWVSSSNDGWFPSPVLAYDHCLHARILAASVGMPLFRSTQKGITCIVDGKGSLVAGPLQSQKKHTLKSLESEQNLKTLSTPFIQGVNELMWTAWFLLLLLSQCKRLRRMALGV